MYHFFVDYKISKNAESFTHDAGDVLNYITKNNLNCLIRSPHTIIASIMVLFGKAASDTCFLARSLCQWRRVAIVCCRVEKLEKSGGQLQGKVPPCFVCIATSCIALTCNSYITSWWRRRGAESFKKRQLSSVCSSVLLPLPLLANNLNCSHFNALLCQLNASKCTAIMFNYLDMLNKIRCIRSLCFVIIYCLRASYV